MKTNKGTKTKENIHTDHRARMKQSFLKNGFNTFTEIQKIEFLLFFSVPYKDTNPIAHALLDEFKSLSGILDASYESLIKVDGVGEHTAIFLSSIRDYINEYYSDIGKTTHIGGSTDAMQFCKSLYVGKKTEELVIICLDNNNDIINYKVIAKGDQSKVNVELRDITHFILNNGCERIIITHNHPTGNTNPSDDDLAFTQRTMVGLVLQNIEVLDHIIVSSRDTYSFAEHGIITGIKDILVTDKVYKHFNVKKPFKPYKIDKKLD